MTRSTDRVLLDGGLATTLQAMGALPPRTPVEPLLLREPGVVARAHQAFYDAGSDRVLTATFLAGLAAERDVVVEHAAQATGPRGFGSIGPVDGAVDVAGALVAAGIHDVVLETFTDVDVAVDAVRAVRQVEGVRQLVASVVPSDDGSVGGVEASVVHDRLRAAGADVVGANCCSVRACAAFLDAAPRDAIGWAKPNGTSDAGVWADAVARLPARFLGGCCGAGPEHIAALARALDRRGHAGNSGASVDPQF